MTISTTVDTAFAEDVRRGLSATPKHIPSQYFYDAKGSELFQQIMRAPEYYLTRAEYEIFETQAAEILEVFRKGGEPFRLIEFGAGDGLKTKLLLRHFLDAGASFTYTPIDISGEALRQLAQSLAREMPNLVVEPFEGEYFTALHKLSAAADMRQVVLFLGSNIGNFTEQKAINFLRAVRSELHQTDLFMLGYDLKKDPARVRAAYNDAGGATRAFNLNLLRRMNNELGANFDLEGFVHEPTYDPMTGEARSYLLSTRQQSVYIEALGQSFSFRPWEPIWLELSQKYDPVMMEKLAKAAGFEITQLFTDKDVNFTDAVWKPHVNL